MLSHTANNQLWLDMEKELAELRAENERMENLLALDVHTCGPNCQRDGCVNRRLREELESLLSIEQHFKAQYAKRVTELAAQLATLTEQRDLAVKMLDAAEEKLGFVEAKMDESSARVEQL